MKINGTEVPPKYAPYVELLEKCIAYNPEYGIKLWHIITALRSCDSMPVSSAASARENRSRLKHLTTARLRAVVYGSNLKACIADKNSTPLTEYEIEEARELLQAAPCHFREHFIDAVRGLELLGYECSDLTELISHL